VVLSCQTKNCFAKDILGTSKNPDFIPTSALREKFFPYILFYLFNEKNDRKIWLK
jgi:hypothetical protein